MNIYLKFRVAIILSSSVCFVLLPTIFDVSSTTMVFAVGVVQGDYVDSSRIETHNIHNVLNSEPTVVNKKFSDDIKIVSNHRKRRSATTQNEDSSVVEPRNGQVLQEKRKRRKRRHQRHRHLQRLNHILQTISQSSSNEQQAKGDDERSDIQSSSSRASSENSSSKIRWMTKPLTYTLPEGEDNEKGNHGNPYNSPSSSKSRFEKNKNVRSMKFHEMNLDDGETSSHDTNLQQQSLQHATKQQQTANLSTMKKTNAVKTCMKCAANREIYKNFVKYDFKDKVLRSLGLKDAPNITHHDVSGRSIKHLVNRFTHYLHGPTTTTSGDSGKYHGHGMPSTLAPRKFTPSPRQGRHLFTSTTEDYQSDDSTVLPRRRHQHVSSSSSGMSHKRNHNTRSLDEVSNKFETSDETRLKREIHRLTQQIKQMEQQAASNSFVEGDNDDEYFQPNQINVMSKPLPDDHPFRAASSHSAKAKSISDEKVLQETHMFNVSNVKELQHGVFYYHRDIVDVKMWLHLPRISRSERLQEPDRAGSHVWVTLYSVKTSGDISNNLNNVTIGARDENDEKSVHLVQQVATKIPMENAKDGGWIEMDVFEVLEEHVLLSQKDAKVAPKMILIYFKVETSNGVALPVGYHDQPHSAPFLEITLMSMNPILLSKRSPPVSSSHLKRVSEIQYESADGEEKYSTGRRSSRRKRNLHKTCTEERDANESSCCLWPFTIDFENEFGWNWIIYPPKYEANFCSGECSLGSTAPSSNPWAHLLSQANSAPCCAPQKMSPINMIYMDENKNVILGSLPNMKVEKCGCA